MRLAATLALSLMALPALGSDGATGLSQKAAGLQIGMSGCDVVSVLGQPTWIFTREDLGDKEGVAGTEWKWENAQCFPIIVGFDRDTGLVSGWDEGRSFCLESADEMARFLPADQFRVSEARNTGCIR